MKELSKGMTEYAVGCFVSIYQSRGMKQTELERISDVDQSTISKIIRSRENGEKYTPSPDILDKLFQALGIKLAHILGEAEHLADEIIERVQVNAAKRDSGQMHLDQFAPELFLGAMQAQHND